MIRQAQARFHEMDAEERSRAYNAMQMLTDDELAEEIREGEVQLHAPAAPEAVVREAAACLDKVPPTIASAVIAWADGDPVLALAALTIERRRHQDFRRRDLERELASMAGVGGVG